MITVGFLRIGRQRRQANRVPTYSKRNDIREIVRGIREQGQAVGEKPRRNFDNDKQRRQNERKRKSRCGLFRDITEMRMGMSLLHWAKL